MEGGRRSGDSNARAALRSRMAHPTSVRLEELQPNPDNPRYSYDDPETRELAATLNLVGQIQAALIVSRDQYVQAYPGKTAQLGPQPWVVLVGNRRLAAASLAGRPALEVRVADELDTAEAMEDRILIENVQRKDLPPLLEAAHLQRRLSRDGQTTRSVGAAIGKSHAYVQQRLDLLKLIPGLQERLRAGDLNIKTARKLAVLPVDEQRTRLAEGPPFLREDPAPPPAASVNGEVSGNPVSKETTDISPTDVDADEPDKDRDLPAGRAGGAASSARREGEADTTAMQSDAAPETRASRAAVQESVRASVTQCLLNALRELDRVVPVDGEAVALDTALAESQRHILAAYNELRDAVDPRPSRSGQTR
jgi:ParB family chromosome partitioning protein